MATRKEIELILQARLDASNNVLNDAEKLGEGIAERLESAFERMGERIGELIAKNIERSISNVGNQYSGGSFGLTGANPRSSGAPDGILPFGFSTNSAVKAVEGSTGSGLTRNSNSATNPSNLNDPLAPINPQQQTTHGADVDARLKLSRLFSSSGSVAAGLHSRLFTGDYSDRMTRMGSDKIFDRLNESDADLRALNRLEQNQKAGRSMTLEDVGVSKDKLLEKASLFDRMAKDSDTGINQLNSELKDLTKELERTRAEYRDGKVGLEALRSAEKSRDIKYQELTAAEEGQVKLIHGAGKMRQHAAPDPFFSSKNGLMMAGGLEIASKGLHFAAELPLIQARNEAAAARTGNMEARMAMDKNWGGMLGLEMAGGKDALKKEAESSYYKSLAGLGVGTVAATAAAFSTGPVGAMAFGSMAVGAGAKFGTDFMNREASVEGKMNTLLESSNSKNAEELKLKGGSVGWYSGAFRGAQNLGSRQFESMLALENGGWGAAEYGLNRDDLRSNAYTMASIAGGSFGNAGSVFDMKGASSSALYKTNLFQTQMGQADASGVVAKLAYGNSQYGQVRRTREETDRSFAESMEKGLGFMADMKTYGTDMNLAGGAVSRMISSAGEAGAQGYGNSENAQSDARRMLGFAAGPNRLNSQGIDLLSGMNDRLQSSLFQQGGIEEYARVEELQAFERETGIKLSKADRIRFLKGRLTPSYLKKLAKDQGVDIKANTGLSADDYVSKSDARGARRAPDILDAALGEGYGAALESRNVNMEQAALETAFRRSGEAVPKGIGDEALESLPDTKNMTQGQKLLGMEGQSDMVNLNAAAKMLQSTFDDLGGAIDKLKTRLDSVAAAGSVTNAELESVNSKIKPRTTNVFNSFEGKFQQMTEHDIYTKDSLRQERAEAILKKGGHPEGVPQ